MSPLVSFLTASYNRQDYLAEAIASVESQAAVDCEHLVYDHSDDPRVHDVLAAAKARRPDRFFFASPGVRSPALPALYWNILAGLAHGRYLTILDDDNRKDLGFSVRMAAPLNQDPALDVVTCGWRRIDGQGHEVGDPVHWNRLTSIPRLWQSNTIDSNAFLIRREAFDRVGLFRTDLSCCEDWDYAIRMARTCRMIHLDETLFDRREHAGAQTERVARADLYATWNRLRREHFTAEEERAALALGREVA